MHLDMHETRWLSQAFLQLKASSATGAVAGAEIGFVDVASVAEAVSALDTSRAIAIPNSTFIGTPCLG